MVSLVRFGMSAVLGDEDFNEEGIQNAHQLVTQSLKNF
jgi:hypothetical protein